MSRVKNRIKLKPTLFISCEGTSTEYEYFKSISEIEEVSSLFQYIEIYPRKDEINIKNTCRISLYFYNTKEEIDYTIDVLKESLKFLRRIKI